MLASRMHDGRLISSGDANLEFELDQESRADFVRASRRWAILRLRASFALINQQSKDRDTISAWRCVRCLPFLVLPFCRSELARFIITASRIRHADGIPFIRIRKTGKARIMRRLHKQLGLPSRKNIERERKCLDWKNGPERCSEQNECFKLGRHEARTGHVI